MILKSVSGLVTVVSWTVRIDMPPDFDSHNINIAQYPCMKPVFLPLLLAIIIDFA